MIEMLTYRGVRTVEAEEMGGLLCADGHCDVDRVGHVELDQLGQISQSALVHPAPHKSKVSTTCASKGGGAFALDRHRKSAGPGDAALLEDELIDRDAESQLALKLRGHSVGADGRLKAITVGIGETAMEGQRHLGEAVHLRNARNA